jgi:hypothetical protein
MQIRNLIIFFFFFLSLWFYSPLDLGGFFSFLILYTVGRTPWTGDQLVARPLPTYRITQTQNKRTETSGALVGFEPTIPVFERAKTVHALDHAATVIGFEMYYQPLEGTGCVYQLTLHENVNGPVVKKPYIHCWTKNC